MSSRVVWIGVVACLAAAVASSDGTPVRPSLHPAPGSGSAQLRAFGGRSPRQRGEAAVDKLDGTLADLARHAVRTGSVPSPATLHSMSPAAKFKLAADGSTPLVSVDAVTRGDPARLLAALQALGLEHGAVYANDVGGWLPVSQLGAVAATAEVHALRAALSRTRSGLVTSQGDFVQQSAALRSGTGLTGSGVTVGVLSDSFDCYSVYAAPNSGVPASGYAGYAPNGFLATAANDVSSGDLSSVQVLEEANCLDYGAPANLPFGDEGRAMLQIVHDVAPAAGLAFYTAENSEADFAAGIGKLAAAGAKVIADDVGYFDEPFYQDGILAQAINAVEAPTTSGGYGVAYFSAAGNDGNAAYETLSPTFPTLATTGANSGEYLLNFDGSAATTTTSLPISIDALAPGEFATIVVEWDQPYVTGAPSSGGATSRIDVCVTGAGADSVEDLDGNAETCTGANAAGVDPVQVLVIANPANASGSTPQETLALSIGLAGGSPAPGRLKVAVETDGQQDPPITRFATQSATLQGHPGAAGAAAVGAAFFFETPACGTTPAVLEAYSSEGGTPILFDATGARLAAPVVRQKPDFVGPDGGNDTFLGFTLASAGDTGTNGELPTSVAACQNDPSYPNFFGTSAATPHVAGIGALILQANSAVTPSQLYAALQTSAVPMGAPAGVNFYSGYGLVQADAALALIPPGAPTLTATGTPTSSGAITSGTTFTITWSSVNAQQCTASGSWSGTLAASGSQTLTAGAAGAYSYDLGCSNAAGNSQVTALSITAVAAPARGGGGGALTWVGILGLAAIAAFRVRVNLDRG